jgi:uncharacterized protein YecE (DUF72 family)
MQFYIGTSGWVYPHWREKFYPQDMAESEWLDYYARHLNCVELNRSFYRLPSTDNIREWVEATPENFLFAVKASRYITHMKKLKDPDKTLKSLIDVIGGMGDKLGPLLFQLPPRWSADPERLAQFLEALPDDLKVAVECRDHSWHSDEIMDCLSAYNAAFCVYDLDGFTSPAVTTADFVYLRLHGPDGAYSGSYSDAQLREWANWLRQQPVKSAFVFFDNDQEGYAVKNALALHAILSN